MNMIIESIGGLLAVVGFSTMLHVPGKYKIWSGIAGGLGWFVYLWLLQITGNELVSTFMGSAVISICAHICARVFKTPVNMFVIPANMTLVPGAGMYRTVYYLLQGDDGMSFFYLQQTLLAAGMIAMGMFIVNIMVNMILHSRSIYLEKRGKKFQESI